MFPQLAPGRYSLLTRKSRQMRLAGAGSREQGQGGVPDRDVDGHGVLDVRSERVPGIRDDFTARQLPMAGGDGDDGIPVSREAMPRRLRGDVVRDCAADEAGRRMPDRDVDERVLDVHPGLLRDRVDAQLPTRMPDAGADGLQRVQMRWEVPGGVRHVL